MRLYWTGRAGAGKTLAARMSFVWLGEGDLLHLSDGVRREVQSRHLEVTRRTLQEIGDELRALRGPAWLVEEAARRKGRILVVDDLRLVQEAEVLRAAGWRGIRVTAPPDLRHARLLRRDGHLPGGDWESHPTEIQTDVVPVDLEIANDGSLLALMRRVHEAIEGLPHAP